MAAFSATAVAKPKMNVTTTEPPADSRSTDVVAIGAAVAPIASTTITEATTIRVETSVRAEVTEPRIVRVEARDRPSRREPGAERVHGPDLTATSSRVTAFRRWRLSTCGISALAPKAEDALE